MTNQRPKPRLTRDLVARLPERVDAEGPIVTAETPPNWHEEICADILAQLAPNEPLWVFAIGSLIWNPRMPVADRAPALVRGWQRSFCIGPVRRMRGNPDAPGYMLSLDRGGECWGVVLQMDMTDPHTTLTALLKAEPPVAPSWVMAETDAGPRRAIAFTVNDTFPMYVPEPPIDNLADALASAVGTRGTMADYLLNTLTELQNAGIHDPHIWRLQDMVAERLERLEPPR